VETVRIRITSISAGSELDERLSGCGIVVVPDWIPVVVGE